MKKKRMFFQGNVLMIKYTLPQNPLPNTPVRFFDIIGPNHGGAAVSLCIEFELHKIQGQRYGVDLSH